MQRGAFAGLQGAHMVPKTAPRRPRGQATKSTSSWCATCSAAR
jgi:hypothetical protein